MWIWDAAGLEAGEVAIYTSGSSIDRWVATVAAWKSLRDVVRLDLGGGWEPVSGVTNQAISEPQESASWLSRNLRGSPGVVAVVLTTEAVATDVLLEALPMWSRFVLAMPASMPTTVDFYNNVHRKGANLVCVPASTREMHESQWSPRSVGYLQRAARVLDCARLAAKCPL